jgi:hypothetical protein
MKIVAITPDKKLDCVCAPIIEGMNDCGVEVIASDPGNSVIKTFSESEILRHAKDADYIFAFFGKVRGNNPPRYHLLNSINRPESSVYIDGSEWTSTGYPDGKETINAPWGIVNSQVYEAKFNSKRCKGTPWINESMKSFCKWYFKRECYPEDAENEIIPLMIGCQKKFFGNYSLKKDIDVFCSFGQLNNGFRYEIQNFCYELKNKGYNVVIKSGLDYQDYLQHINRSFISLSSWGAGNSCMRMWENMANSSCCFSQRAETLFPHKPQDGIHYVEYSNMQEFKEKIYHYLNNKNKCVDIGDRGLDFVKKHHTGKARFESIIKTILTRD